MLLVLVVGDAESANSGRLANIASSKGKPSYLIPDATAIKLEWLEGVNTILLTSGASVPESLVQEVITFLKQRGPCTVEERELIQEDVHFRLPVAVA